MMWLLMVLVVHGSSLYFDGNDDYVEHSGNLSSYFDLSTDFKVSIIVWINYTKDYAIGNYGAICGQGYLANEIGYGIFVSGTNNDKVCFQVRQYTDMDDIEGADINDGNWHQVVGIRDGSNNKTYIYVDAVLKDSAVGNSINIDTLYSNFVLGRRPTSNLHWFEGQIGSIILYSRVINDEEIIFNYHHPDMVYSTDSLVAWYKFNEFSGDTLYDSSGNGNDGVINGATWTIDTPVSLGKSEHGSSLYFDGNDYVTISDNDSLDFGTDDFSISFWIKFTELSGHNWLMSKRNSFKQKELSLFREDLSNKIYFRTGDGGVGVDLISTDTVMINKWYNIVFIRNGNSHSIYINGSLDTTYSFTPYDLNNSNPLYLASLGGSGNYFYGNAKSVMIFKGRALSSSEIEWNYNHAGEIYNTDGLVAWYKFSEFSGDTLYDASGNNNNGIINGATWSIDVP